MTPRAAYVSGFIAGYAGLPAEPPPGYAAYPLVYARGHEDGARAGLAGISRRVAMEAGWAHLIVQGRVWLAEHQTIEPLLTEVPS